MLLGARLSINHETRESRIGELCELIAPNRSLLIFAQLKSAKSVLVANAEKTRQAESLLYERVDFALHPLSNVVLGGARLLLRRILCNRDQFISHFAGAGENRVALDTFEFEAAQMRGELFDRVGGERTILVVIVAWLVRFVVAQLERHFERIFAQTEFDFRRQDWRRWNNRLKNLFFRVN